MACQIVKYSHTKKLTFLVLAGETFIQTLAH